eukprot:5691194-Pleurochrysis_carterae.AAC.1
MARAMGSAAWRRQHAGKGGWAGGLKSMRRDSTSTRAGRIGAALCLKRRVLLFSPYFNCADRECGRVRAWRRRRGP